MPRLLLASASPARLATLQRAGLEPIVAVSGIDEAAELRTARGRFGQLDPADEALVLARAKAEAVERDRAERDVEKDDLASVEQVVILGCDSILEFNGVSWGKPRTIAEAHERWLQMSGNSGVLHTGHWVIDPASGGAVGATSSTEVHFATLKPDEIEAYLGTGEPLGVAGAFTIDGYGGWFIERITGDHHGVVGVSLPLVRKLLAQLGLSVTDLWR
ncbi:MAG TPA: Maf family protein [Actinomycetales bacterium]|nr:Maf family protein [Actinomycetales bacterium]